MATAGSIVIDLLLKTGSFVTDVARSEKNLKELAKTAKNFGIGFSAAGLAAGAGFSYMLKRQIDLMDNMSKMAQQAGVTTEVLSSLGYAAEMSGSSNEEMASTLAKLNKAMFDAANGTGEAKSALDALGLSVLDSGGALKGADQMFTDIADKLSKMQDETQKSALAQRVFGEEGKKLIPLLNSGKDGIEAMRKEAERLGIVIDGDAAKAAENFNDNIARLQKIGQGWINEIATQAVPILDAFTQQMWALSTETDVMGGNAESLQKQKVSDWAKTSTLAIAALADIVSTLAVGITSMGSAFDGLTSGAALRYQQAVRLMGNLTLDLFSIVTPEETTRRLRMDLERAYTDAYNVAIEARRNLDKKTEGFEFGYYTKLAQSTLDGIESGEIEPYVPGKPGNRPVSTAEASKFAREQERAAQEYQRFIGDITGRADAARQAQQEAWLYHALTIGDITGQEFANAMNSITGAIDEESQSFWERYLEGAEKALSSFDELSHDVIKNFTSDFGNAFESMIFDSQNLGDALSNFADGMARNFVNAVGQMIAQWLVFKAVTGILGAFSGGIGATAMGPGSTLGGAGAVAFPVNLWTGGYTGDGGKYDPAGIVHRGEYVFSQEATKRIGVPQLERLHRGYADGGLVGSPALPSLPSLPGAPAQGNSSPPLNVSVNLIEDESRAGQVSQRQTGDREYILDVVVSDIMGGGRVTKTGMQHLGWKRHGT